VGGGQPAIVCSAILSIQFASLASRLFSESELT
jgi:hypothetical protein